MRRSLSTPRLTLAAALAFILAVALEPRAAHALDIQWIDDTGGDFSDPANWSPAQVPGFEDRALVTLAGTYTVNVGSIDQLYMAELVFGGSSGQQTLHFAPGGQLGVEGALTIGANAVVILENESSLRANGAAEVAGSVEVGQADFDASEGIHNTGTIELTEASPSGRFLNEGVLRAHGMCSFGTIENAVSGTFEARTGPGLFPGAFMDSLINYGDVSAGPSIMFVAGALMSNERNGVLVMEASTTANAETFRNAGVWRIAPGSHCDGLNFVQLASGELAAGYAPGGVAYKFVVQNATLAGTLAPVFDAAFTPPPGNLPLIFKESLEGQFAIVSPAGTHGIAVEAAYLDQVYVRVVGPGLVITPPAGADTGPVSALITGSDLATVTQARLTRAGQPSIFAEPVSFDADTKTVYATFDLTGRAQGLWNVEVEGPGGTQSAPDLFTIVQDPVYRQPIRVELQGGGLLRRGGSRQWSLAIFNPNQTDERGAVEIVIPPGLIWELIAPRPGEAASRKVSGLYDSATKLLVPDVLAPPGLTMTAVRVRLTLPVNAVNSSGTLHARWYQP